MFEGVTGGVSLTPILPHSPGKNWAVPPWQPTSVTPLVLGYLTNFTLCGEMTLSMFKSVYIPFLVFFFFTSQDLSDATDFEQIGTITFHGHP